MLAVSKRPERRVSLALGVVFQRKAELGLRTILMSGVSEKMDRRAFALHGKPRESVREVAEYGALQDAQGAKLFDA